MSASWVEQALHVYLVEIEVKCLIAIRLNMAHQVRVNIGILDLESGGGYRKPPEACMPIVSFFRRSKVLLEEFHFVW